MATSSAWWAIKCCSQCLLRNNFPLIAAEVDFMKCKHVLQRRCICFTKGWNGVAYRRGTKRILDWRITLSGFRWYRHIHVYLVFKATLCSSSSVNSGLFRNPLLYILHVYYIVLTFVCVGLRKHYSKQNTISSLPFFWQDTTSNWEAFTLITVPYIVHDYSLCVSFFLTSLLHPILNWVCRRFYRKNFCSAI